jgi:hypothetical protein
MIRGRILSPVTTHLFLDLDVITTGQRCEQLCVWIFALYNSTHLSVCLVCLSVHPSVRPSVRPSIHLIYLTYLSVYFFKLIIQVFYVAARPESGDQRFVNLPLNLIARQGKGNTLVGSFI